MSTIAEAFDAFLRHGQAQGWSSRTVANYSHFLGLLSTHLSRVGCRRLADVVPPDLDGLLDHLKVESRAKKSRVQCAILVKQLFAWLQERGRIISNPSLALPLPDDGEEPLPDPPLSEEEVQNLLASLPRSSNVDLRNRCLLELLYGCGLRMSEARGLDLADIDLHAGVMRVRGGKGGQNRLLPLLDTASAAVKDWLAVRRQFVHGPDRGALFLNQYGQRMSQSSIYNFFERLNAARGPDARRLHPHLFRHSIAVHWVRGGASIRHVQDLLGHAHLDTTKVYLRLVPGRLKEDYDRAMPEIAVGLEQNQIPPSSPGLDRSPS